MGLTDPKGKMIYMADGLSVDEANETLIHEIVHMEGRDLHDKEFSTRCMDYQRRAQKKLLVWEGVGE